MKQRPQLPSHACYTHYRAGGYVLGPHLFPSAWVVPWGSPFPRIWPSSLLFCCVHSLPHRLAAGTGTLVLLKFGHAALSIHFPMKKWGHLKPERAFLEFFRILFSAFQKSHCLPLFLKCTIFTKKSLTWSDQQIELFHWQSRNKKKRPKN